MYKNFLKHSVELQIWSTLPVIAFCLIFSSSDELEKVSEE